MKMDKVASSKNDEFYTPEYAITPILKYLKKGSTVWNPFDQDWSLYPVLLEKNGFNVLNTHIEDGHDFFKIPPLDCDYIISNPPYTLKYEVFRRLFQIGKPFAMLVGVVGLFESQKRFNLFAKNEFEIMYFNKRVAYYQDKKDTLTTLSPPFSSVYICKDILPKKLSLRKLIKVNLWGVKGDINAYRDG